jgi:pimeloyl-ACP methyl ester carboxylesterase
VPDPSSTERFVERWHAGATSAVASLNRRAAETTIVFVRGYLGNYMPRNLSAPCAAMRQAGFDAFIGDNRAGGTVAGNVAMLARQLEARPIRPRLVLCGHSRGAVEALTLLAQHPAIAQRCDGVVMSQAPHGHSFVMESVLFARHREPSFSSRRRTSEAVQRTTLGLIGARSGGRELTSEIWPTLIQAIDRISWPFPVLQTASWSSQPTAWLDSFHERLGEIGPGRAHDGQFFLEDLLWPALPHVLLPHLDHAQPAMGGFGFDPARYWLTSLSVLLG